MPTSHSDQIIDVLKNGTMDVEGQFMWGSNYTFLTDVEHNGNIFKAVYKPIQGAFFPCRSRSGNVYRE
jgi:hypothetical protein